MTEAVKCSVCGAPVKPNIITKTGIELLAMSLAEQIRLSGNNAVVTADELGNIVIYVKSDSLVVV